MCFKLISPDSGESEQRDCAAVKKSVQHSVGCLWYISVCVCVCGGGGIH